LKRLNIEGNQLAGLPSTALTLPLTHLLPGDNLMHPLLWHENTRNQPQVAEPGRVEPWPVKFKASNLGLDKFGQLILCKIGS